MALATVGAYYAFPTKVAGFLIGLARRKAGLTKKTVHLDDHAMAYLEGGTGNETILLLHGFAGNKDHWLAMAPYLRDYHLVIPDLAGHGESSKREDAKYDTLQQIDRLHQLVRQLQLGRFHLAGNSMGGMFSGAYAARYPQDVISVGLFNAAGVKSPDPSEADEMIARGENPLSLAGEADFARLADMAFFKQPFAPYPLKRQSIQTALANNPFNQKMLQEISPEAHRLEADLPKIQAPTLILWGADDRILDISCVPAFEAGLKNHQAVILPHCGHMPMIEKPRDTANAYLAFLKDLAS
jgi:pimeloyl-ACP methyl ester carboxylesterase